VATRLDAGLIDTSTQANAPLQNITFLEHFALAALRPKRVRTRQQHENNWK
jgi:hypothetical protein